MNTRSINFQALFFLLIAMAFSGWNAWPSNEPFCLTESCNVFNDFTVFNVSLWLYSFIFTSFTFLLVIFNYTTVAYALLSLALIGDTLLLILMMLTAPCFNCLIIAFLFACSYLSLLSRPDSFTSKKQKSIPLIFYIWLIFFIINNGALLKSLVNPYAIYINPQHSEDVQEASMRIYFSPSCSACKTAVNLLGNPEATAQNDIAWFPVPESKEDIILIRQMQDYIEQGDTLKQALEKTVAQPQEFAFSTIIPDFIMQCKLLINQAHLSSAGTTRIPFVEYTGLPAHLNKQEVNLLENLSNLAPHHSNNQDSFELPFNLGVDAFCDGESTEPCE